MQGIVTEVLWYVVHYLDDHLIQLKMATGTLNAPTYQDEILESGVRSPLDSLDDQNMVFRDDIEIPPCTHIIE